MDEITAISELRSLILKKTGIRTITPADCKRISIEISKTINKNVSETTIKRLFGFAMVRHNFSKFTLATLGEYVNDISDSQSSQISLEDNDINDSKWDRVKKKAARITQFTLKSIKNRSGIPFSMTVSRKFSEHDFDDFTNSSYSFTSFISQPGYGKTIILGHLAEKFISKSDSQNKNSTLVFLTIYSLFNKENVQYNFENLLKHQLGIADNESLISLANDNYKLTGGKLFIFLDGFSEILVQKDLKKQLFDNIIDFICAIEDSPAIKIVMSMRSTTWSRFYDCIRNSTFLKRKWFPGNYFNLSDISNVPELTEREVETILNKIHHIDAGKVNPRLKSQLKFPFHIQLYYQLKEEDPYFNYSTNITFYELTSKFIQDKIYRSNYYTEKVLFLKKIVLLTDLGKKRHVVSKDDLISELSAFKNAYMELLSDGILMEERFPDEALPKEYVSFIQPHIFEYFLFVEILEKFNLRIDASFFQHLKDEYKNHHARFQLLQWTIRFAIRIGELGCLENVFSFGLNRFENSYIILFIAENLDYGIKYVTKTIDHSELDKLHSVLIKQLLSFDFADVCYKEAIEILTQQTTNRKHLLVYKSIQMLSALLGLDGNTIDKLNHETELQFGIEFGNLLRGEASEENIMQGYRAFITSLNPDETEHTKNISLLGLAISTALFSSNKNAIEIINLITAYTISSANRDHTLITLINTTNKLIKKIDFEYHDQDFKSGEETTKFSESIFKLIQVYQLKKSKDYAAALSQSIELLKIFKVTHLNLYALYTYDLIIDILKDTKDNYKATEYMHEKLAFIEERELMRPLVIKQYDY